jgi:hypothetical protein
MTSLLVTTDSELSKVAAPNLPAAPTEYSSTYHDSANNILRLFFNQVVKILGQLKAGEGLGNYADDTAAAAAGVPLNGLYRTASVVKIRVT